MATERSTVQSHQEHPDQREYDYTYYKLLYPYIVGNVLDIGAGSGMFVNYYKDKEGVISVRRLDKYEDEEKQNEVWQVPQEINGNYDTIVSTEFIEHITEEHLDMLLANIKNILKKGGLFIGSTPNVDKPSGNPFHLKEYNVESLKEKLEKYFNKVKIETFLESGQIFICQN